MDLRIVSFNLNGIRAAWKKGLEQWLDSQLQDCENNNTALLICFQEVRATEEQVQTILPSHWDIHVHDCEIKGRAGVAIMMPKNNPFTVENIRENLPPHVYEDEIPQVDTGRWLEMDLNSPQTGSLTLTSAYLHAGSLGSHRQDQKMAHLSRLVKHLTELESSENKTLICGDFNVVRTPNDIKNWKTNHNKSSGVMDEEIAYLEQWMGTEGYWSDVQRLLQPEGDGPYTWWSWRGRAFQNNAGWRIDYHMANPQMAQKAHNFTVHRAQSYETRISDHAALSITYKF